MVWVVNLNRRFAENEVARVSFARNLKGDIIEPVVTPKRGNVTDEEPMALAEEAAEAFREKAKRWVAGRSGNQCGRDFAISLETA